MKCNRISQRDANYIPEHQAKGFQNQLIDLVNNLEEESFKVSYLKSEFLTKYSDQGTTSPDDRRAAAITKWLAVEETNRKTNERILLGDNVFKSREKVTWATSDSIIGKARRIVSDVLGPLDLGILFGGAHTNGASTRVRRSPKAAILKHTGQAHVSSSALKYWMLYASNTRLSNQDLEIQEESVMFTVPKNSEIDRVACKEPEINMFLQRMAGKAIRRKLRRHGIDLRDQSINQRLAASAYRDGLATIDLSSASDSISTQLVCELLPVDWFCLLNDLRVKQTIIDGTTHDLEMFSSMGNGFTFELESLLFFALTRAICWESGIKGRVSVYGDDIIAPSLVAPRLARTFSWFGFTVNPKKSHWSGKFRESCGVHFHNSREVTPFYLRAPVRQLTDVIRVLNQLLKWDSGGTKSFWTESIAEFHLKWSKIVPERLYGSQDVDSVDCLVTGHRPRKRLALVQKSLDFPQEAGLTYWFTARGEGFDPFYCDPKTGTRYKCIKNTDFRRGTSLWAPYIVLCPSVAADHV